MCPNCISTESTWIPSNVTPSSQSYPWNKKFDLLGWLTVTTTRPTIDLTTVWPTEALAHTLRNPAALSDNWLYFGMFSSATLYSRSLPYLFNLISSFTFVCGRIPQCIKVHVRFVSSHVLSLSHVVCYGMGVCVWYDCYMQSSVTNTRLWLCFRCSGLFLQPVTVSKWRGWRMKY